MDDVSSGPVDAGDPIDGLLSRLEVIEQQPLGERAPAYQSLADALEKELGSADHAGVSR